MISIEKLRNTFDYIFLSLFVFSSFLGNKSVVPLVVFGVFPVFYHIKESNFQKLFHFNSVSLKIFAAYIIYGIGALFFFKGLGPGDKPPVNPDIELYALAIILFVFGYMRGDLIVDIAVKHRRVLPWSLAATFVVLTGYAILNVSGDGRVQAEAPWPFIPALIFATWSFLSLVGWRDLSFNERWLRLCLLSASILVVNGYTGSRGLGIAQLAVFLALFVAAFQRKYCDGLPRIRELAAALAVGLCLLGVQQTISGYGALLRLQYISQLTYKFFPPVETKSPKVMPVPSTPADPSALSGTPESSPFGESKSPTPAGASSSAGPSVNSDAPISTISQDASISVRLAMWSVSIKSFLDAPIFGHGSLSMKPIIQDRFALQHNHNQYLTWMVTGGLLLLGLGLAFLSLPYFVSGGLPDSDRLVFTLSITVFWGVGMLFDSFLSLKFYLHYYCMMLGFLMSMAGNIRAQRERSAHGAP